MQSLAKEYNKPLVLVHHLAAHCLVTRVPSVTRSGAASPASAAAPPLSPLAEADAGATSCNSLTSATAAAPVSFPFLGLIASGGHTSLLVCHDAGRFSMLGGTLDDALGESFDKAARMLGILGSSGSNSSSSSEERSSSSSGEGDSDTESSGSGSGGSSGCAGAGSHSSGGATVEAAAARHIQRQRSSTSSNCNNSNNSSRNRAVTAEEEQWRAKHLPLPVPMRSKPGLDFSFSGLKNAFREAVLAARMVFRVPAAVISSTGGASDSAIDQREPTVNQDDDPCDCDDERAMLLPPHIVDELCAAFQEAAFSHVADRVKRVLAVCAADGSGAKVVGVLGGQFDDQSKSTLSSSSGSSSSLSYTFNGSSHSATIDHRTGHGEEHPQVDCSRITKLAVVGGVAANQALRCKLQTVLRAHNKRQRTERYYAQQRRQRSGADDCVDGDNTLSSKRGVGVGSCVSEVARSASSNSHNYYETVLGGEIDSGKNAECVYDADDKSANIDSDISICGDAASNDSSRSSGGSGSSTFYDSFVALAANERIVADAAVADGSIGAQVHSDLFYKNVLAQGLPLDSYSGSSSSSSRNSSSTADVCNQRDSDSLLYSGAAEGTAATAASSAASASASVDCEADGAGRADVELVCPPPVLCTDNGVMVAWAAIERLRLGQSDDICGAEPARSNTAGSVDNSSSNSSSTSGEGVPRKRVGSAAAAHAHRARELGLLEPYPRWKLGPAVSLEQLRLLAQHTAEAEP